MLWSHFAQSSSKPESTPPQAPAPEEYEDASDAVGDVLMTMAPWANSVLLHAGLALLVMFAVWNVAEEVPDDEPIIPIANLSQEPGAVITQTVHTPKTSPNPAPSRRDPIANTPSTGGGPGSGIIGNVGAGTTGGGDTGVTAVFGTIGISFSDGSNSPFAAVTSSNHAYQSEIFGQGGNGKRVVYLIDASGSLIESLPFVIKELQRCIDRLDEEQSFAIIFFQGPEVVEVPPYGLTKATRENKLQAIKWIGLDQGHVVPQGLTSPLGALTRALEYRPDLIHILSDNITGEGIYQVDQRSLLREVNALNKAGTKINAIQFIYPDPLVKAGMTGTLELLADRTGGDYKYLDGRELGIE